MSEAKYAIAVVDNDESVCSAMNQLVHSLAGNGYRYVHKRNREKAS